MLQACWHVCSCILVVNRPYIATLACVKKLAVTRCWTGSNKIHICAKIHHVHECAACAWTQVHMRDVIRARDALLSGGQDLRRPMNFTAEVHAWKCGCTTAVQPDMYDHTRCFDLASACLPCMRSHL